MQPLADRVIVRPTPEDQIRASGLVIPDVAQEKPQGGVVVAVGPGALSTKTAVRLTPEVVKGDAVLYSRYGGTEIKVDDEDLIVLKESDIIAKLT